METHSKIRFSTLYSRVTIHFHIHIIIHNLIHSYIFRFDVNADGVKEIVVAYSDGRIETRMRDTGEILDSFVVDGGATSSLMSLSSLACRGNDKIDLVGVSSDGFGALLPPSLPVFFLNL
jgi:hypothetical protein